MHDKCDILILTASFGSGHISVSNAIIEHIKEREPDMKIVTIDLYKIVNPRLSKSIYKAYSLLVKHGYKLYNYEYYKKKYRKKESRLYTPSNRSLSKLAKLANELKPRIVISTFPNCTGYMSRYKETYKDNIPLLTCITDVVDNNEWLHKHNDLYFVPVEAIKERLIKKGINKDRIITTGIPIRKMFHNDTFNNKIVREQYGYNETMFIILIMGGSMGILPERDAFFKWINSLNNTKTIILTGKNKGLYNKIINKNYQNIRAIEYADNVSELMRMSNLLISKAGGITLFEAIASRLPFIVYKPTLGQEVENCKFIENYNIGYITYSIEELKNRLILFMKNEDEYDYLSQNLNNISQNIDMDKLVKNILGTYDNV